MDTLPDKSDGAHLACLAQLLAEPLCQSLLRTHPNDVALADPPECWQEWWQAPPEWIHAITNPEALPVPLARLLHAIHALQITRDPTPIHDPLALPTTKGMSPKKQHEVERMVSYIRDLFVVNSLEPSAVRIVDVGAGQGYLTRALNAHFPDTHILALDADEGQTIGAQRWQDNRAKPITHRTILINPTSLLDVVDEWIQPTSDIVVPVLFVALHACGSLTPDTLRAFLLASRRSPATWKPLCAVVVGCCYNLMNPTDFPLSQSIISNLDLPIAAYHLAAQIPAHWLVHSSPKSTPLPSVALAIRKVTWRALLGKAILHAQPSPTPAPTPAPSLNKSATVPARWARRPTIPESAEAAKIGTTPEMRRLGRLRDSTYDNWETFLRVAGERLGVDLSSDAVAIDTTLERRLELLHVLRCLLGPAVESTILLDRLCWMQTALQPENSSLHVRLINLFDQATGSGRNVAIVVAPEFPRS